MNKIIKELNEAVASKCVTFKQMDACIWIEEEYKIEMKRLSNENKLLKHNWKMVKVFLNAKIAILNSLIARNEPEEVIELRALALAYQKALSTMKSLENTEGIE